MGKMYLMFKKMLHKNEQYSIPHYNLKIDNFLNLTETDMEKYLPGMGDLFKKFKQK